MHRVSRRQLIGVVFVIAGLVAAVALKTNPYAVTDWVRLYNYEPPAEIAEIVSATAMTEKARHLFYINHPTLLNKADFRQQCPQYDEQTIVIGCYLSGQRGIHVLRVNDARLEGVEEVTSAHEMLHAAYERLSDSEKRRVNGLLQAYQKNELRDERIKATIENYQRTEPGQELNEMHSIFGTEIAELPFELSEYYQQYFTDRNAVVAAATAYQAAFTSRQSQIKQYDAELATKETIIKQNSNQLERQAVIIERQRASLDALRASQDFEAYNAGVEPFNNSVAAYNGLLDATRQLIAEYNKLVEQRNAIAAQTVELQQAIDSSDLPQSR